MAASSPVTLHVYDLSGGLAKQFSPMVLGKTVDGIWHTGLVAFNTEYYFGGGICADPPGVTPYGVPIDSVSLGATTKTQSEFAAFLASISHRFSMATYHVLDNNCNNFSDACAKFLLGAEKGIPSYIIDLPREAMDSPMGPMLRPMIENMQAGIRDQSAGHELSFGPGGDGAAGAAATAASSTISQPAASPARSPGPSAIASCTKEPLLLARCNAAPVLAKLREFDAEYPPAGDEDKELVVETLVHAEMRATAGKAFPALDLLRVAALRDENACAAVAKEVPRLLGRHVVDPTAPRPDRMMALRVAVNAFKFDCGAVALTKEGAVEQVVEAAAVALENQNAMVSKTAAMLALNVAGASRRFPERIGRLPEEHNVRLLFALVERAKSDSLPAAPDEAYPVVGAIASLVNGDADARELARTLDLNLTPYLDPGRCPDVKTRAVANELDGIMRN